MSAIAHRYPIRGRLQNRARVAWVATSICSVSFCSLADAQNTPSSQEGGSLDQSAAIETVLVTAQRRQERLLDVPISVSVLGVEELERRGLVSREDYLRSVPAVSVRDDGVGLAEIVIRGAYGDSFRTGPTVGLYFGDVPLTGYAIGGSADIKLIDIQRVEVLRGPQGTLYGSNSLSGAIRYIPVEPDLQEFSGSLRAGYSNTARHGGSNNSIDGILNMPLVEDKFAVRAVAFRHFNEGYVRNVAGDDAALQAAAAASGATHLAINEDHVGATEYIGGRVSALWQPTDALGINLTYVNQRDSQDDRLFELRQAGPYRRSDYQLGAVVGGSEDAQRIDVHIVNLTAHYDFDWGTLYSSTAWMEQEFIRNWDIGSLTGLFGTPLKPISQSSVTDADVFAQEVRFTSEFDGPFQLVTGLYYEDSAQPTTQPTFFAGDATRNPFAAVKLWQIDLERDDTHR
jgi:iron complex outermembrane receptor protein